MAIYWQKREPRRFFPIRDLRAHFLPIDVLSGSTLDDTWGRNFTVSDVGGELAMKSLTVLRASLSLYGVILASASGWILVADLARPGVTTIPTNRELAANAATYRDGALWGARIGIVRGDLWQEVAFTYANLEWGAGASVDPALVDQAIANAIHTVRLMPGNSAVWLQLADLTSRFGRSTPNPIEAVKMSYYTGPNEYALAALRLRVSSRLNVAADPELSRLFESDVETSLTNRSDLKEAIASAYRDGSLQARQIISDAAKRIDPAFANSLQNNVVP
jgi:hypothetical protein